MLRLPFYFFLGLIREAGVTLYFRFVSQRRVYGASIVSTALSLLDIFIVARVIIDQDLVGGVAYATGEGVGTFMVLKLTRH